MPGNSSCEFTDALQHLYWCLKLATAFHVSHLQLSLFCTHLTTLFVTHVHVHSSSTSKYLVSSNVNITHWQFNILKTYIFSDAVQICAQQCCTNKLCTILLHNTLYFVCILLFTLSFHILFIKLDSDNEINSNDSIFQYQVKPSLICITNESR